MLYQTHIVNLQDKQFNEQLLGSAFVTETDSRSSSVMLKQLTM